MLEPTSYTPHRGPVDLTACDLEPVHLIASVQSHGALLIFDRESGELLEASDNWREFLPDVEATNYQSILGVESARLLEEIEVLEKPVVLTSSPQADEMEVVAHRSSEKLIIELEQTEKALDFRPIVALNKVIHAVAAAQTSSGYLERLAAELQKALDIDRVMVYRFLPDWAGEVAAEACRETPRYLGLRFPSTDIPEPARRVFQKVWVRHIADVSQGAVPLLSQVGSPSQVDLTQVSIRASSPIHLEYLANMGVQASLTLSLRIRDRLWGLIACHHDSPYLLKPSARASLEVLAQMASFQLSALLDSETLEQRSQAESQLLVMESGLELDEETNLGSIFDEIRDFMEADMLALYENRKWIRKAGVNLEVLENFRSWLKLEAPQNPSLFHRNNLPGDLLPGYAGVLVVAPGEAPDRLACWFRREQAHSVRWAGNPDKSAQKSSGRLNPRASFAEYVELTQGKSLPWSEMDLWKANRFAEVLRAYTLRLQRRLEKKNEALARSNRELDSFAYMAAHDLKEPLRGIHNYATFLREDYAERLEGEGLFFLDGLTNLTEHMTALVDALLTYSRLDQQTLSIQDCDLQAMVEGICQLMELTRQAKIHILAPLPVVQAFPPFLSEILVNLLTNAIKYSDEKNRRVEVGALEPSEDFETFFVRDNGIGIETEFQQEIFHLFRRLHGEGEYGGGSGVGLTIVKKMVDRHGGKVWVESEPKKGSTFFVALPRTQAQSG